MTAFVLAMPSPAGVVILMSIVHALLLASVRSWLGFIMTICKQIECLKGGRKCEAVVSTCNCVHVNYYVSVRRGMHRSPPRGRYGMSLRQYSSGIRYLFTSYALFVLSASKVQ